MRVPTARTTDHALLSSRVVRRAVAWIPLFVLLGATAAATVYLGENRQRAARETFERRTRFTTEALEQRVSTYTEVLYGVQSLFRASHSVTRDEWREYVNQSDIRLRNPGIETVEFIRYVPGSRADDFERRLRADRALRATGYSREPRIRPPGKRRKYFIAEYVEPLRENSARLGFDLGSDTTEAEAIERATETGRPTASLPLTLRATGGRRAGFRMFIPVYRSGVRLMSAEQRRRAFTGFACLGISPNRMLSGIPVPPEIELQIYASPGSGGRPLGAPRGKIPIFSSDPESNEVRPAGDGQHRSAVIDVGGRRWIAAYTSHEGAGKWFEQPAAIGVLAGGAAISFLLFALTFLLSTSRERAVGLARRMTADLRRSEALNAAVVGAALDCVITIDQDGRVREFNPAAEQTFGYSRADVIGKQLADLIIPPSLREMHNRGLARLRSTGESELLDHRVEFTGMRADGREFPVELAVTSIGGEPRMFTGYLRDITERKQAERQRELQYSLTRILAEAPTLEEAVRRVLPVLAAAAGYEQARFWTVDVDVLRCRRVWRADDAASSPAVEESRSAVSSRDGGLPAKSWRSAKAQWGVVSSEKGGAEGDPEPLAELCVPVMVRREVVGVIDLLGAATREPSSEFVRTLTTISGQLGQFIQRKDAEKQFQWQLVQQASVAELGERALEGVDLTELMDAVVETLVEILDVEYANVLEFLPGVEGLLLRAGRGWHPGIVGNATVDTTPGSFASFVLSRLEPVVIDDLDQDDRFDAPQILRDHGVISGVSIVVRGHNEPFGILGAQTTRRRSFNRDELHFLQSVANVLGTAIARARSERLEDQLHQSQRLESVGQLAGGIAHDFNNLLTVIISYASFARDRLAQESEARQDLSEIEKAAKRAADLTHQLLVFSRRDIVRPELVDVNGIVTETQGLLRRTLGEPIDLRTRLEEGLPPVELGAGQLEQVLINLAVNARDAMPDGGELEIAATGVELKTPRFEAGYQVPPGRYVQLRVTDTGAGMSGEVAAQAFEPFYTTKPKGAGTGLGLASVYGIVKRGGGFVKIASKLGKGTAVEIYLPASERRATETDAGHKGEPTKGGGETILVVEDEDGVRTLTERILAEHGYRVVDAEDGESALKACEQEHVDLLLTDVVMPGMSGRELAEQVRLRRPDVPVVYMSGYTADVITRHGVLEEGIALLEKPFERDELLARVRLALADAHDMSLAIGRGGRQTSGISS